MRLLFGSLLMFFAFLLLSLGQSASGQSPSVYTPGPQLPPINQDDPSSEGAAKIRAAMEKKINQERQAQLKRDTEKLLQLTTELKQYVDKTNANVLSVDVIKKAEEIEKLARNVKEKMKGSN